MQFSLFRRAAAAAAAMVAMAAGAAHAESTATASVSATILAPVSMSKTQDLRFGGVVRPESGTSRVSIGANPGAEARCGAGAVCTGASSPAEFSVVGQPGFVVTVAVDPSVRITSPAGQRPITVALTPSASAVTLDAAGASTLYIGGSMDVDGDTSALDYNASFNISVAYQ